MNKGDEIIGTKSKFMSDALTMKDKLGPALCLAKWQQVSLHLTTGMTNSCYHPPLHNIDPELVKTNPSALHNTEYKKAQRIIMLRQEKPTECSYCWNMEAQGELSDRHYRSGEPWAAEHFDTIVNSQGSEDVMPSYVEVNFSNVCNLKCSYCSPQFSSTWAEEIVQHGAYPTNPPHNHPDHFSGRRKPIPHRQYNPYVEAFWSWWPELYPHLKHFRMTGGEPILDKNTYKVFDYVLALPNPDLHLDVTSNFSVDFDIFRKYVNYVRDLTDTNIEHFMQYVSLDTGLVEHAEYIRNGANGNRIHNNVELFLHHVEQKNSLTFIITLNNLSLLGLQNMFEWILNLREKYSKTHQRVWFDTPVLRTPSWQSLQILPAEYVGILEQTANWMEHQVLTEANPFVGFKDYEVQRLRRSIAWMKEGQKLDEAYVRQQRANFYKFFSEYDKRRNTDFLKTFPMMADFWEECKYHAQTI
jgi:organic radical activating enzyme